MGEPEAVGRQVVLCAMRSVGPMPAEWWAKPASQVPESRVQVLVVEVTGAGLADPHVEVMDRQMVTKHLIQMVKTRKVGSSYVTKIRASGWEVGRRLTLEEFVQVQRIKGEWRLGEATS